MRRRSIGRITQGLSLRVWHAELLVVAALAVLAFLVRWPYLQILPHFTDEIHEILTALHVARGEAFPLTAQEAYLGPFHYYILGALFKVIGPKLVLPRLLVLVFGVLTVGATYLLGRSLAGRHVGALGAALLATSPQHTLINSHIAWQNATMPLYSTLCFAAFIAALNTLRPVSGVEPTASPAVARRFGPFLALAGCCFGLTLQTHPGAIILVPPLALAYLIAILAGRRWRLLRSPWLVLAIAAGLLAYSPVLIFNMMNRFDGLLRATAQRPYAYDLQPTWESYRTNFREFALQFARMISDPTRIPATFGDYLTSPYLVIAVVLALVGFLILARRGQPLPLLVAVSAQLILPRFLKAYGMDDDYPMIAARYVAYLLPLGYLAIATTVVIPARQFGRIVLRRYGRPILTNVTSMLWWFVLAVSIAGFVLYPLVPLHRYYEAVMPHDPNNVAAFALYHELAAYTGDTPIVVDSTLDKIATKEGVTARDVAVFLLQFRGIPYALTTNMRETITTSTAGVDPANSAALPLVIMERDTCWPLRERFPFERQGERLRLQNFYRGLPTYFALYRLTPADPGAGCFGPEGPRAGD